MSTENCIARVLVPVSGMQTAKNVTECCFNQISLSLSPAYLCFELGKQCIDVLEKGMGNVWCKTYVCTDAAYLTIPLRNCVIIYSAWHNMKITERRKRTNRSYHTLY